MYFTIDQAGKIEHTNEDTVLALCTAETQYAIKIPKLLKQNIFNRCKREYKNNLVYRIFSYCLYLLLNGRITPNSVIIIDEEYKGHGKDIKNYLLKYLEKISAENIRFQEIGKTDPSHRIANQTFSGKLKPNEIISEKQLNLNAILPLNKQKEYLK